MLPSGDRLRDKDGDKIRSPIVDLKDADVLLHKLISKTEESHTASTSRNQPASLPFALLCIPNEVNRSQPVGKKKPNNNNNHSKKKKTTTQIDLVLPRLENLLLRED